MDPINYIADSIKKPNDELLGTPCQELSQLAQGHLQHSTCLTNKHPTPWLTLCMVLKVERLSFGR